MAWGLWFHFWLVPITLFCALAVILVTPIDRDGKMVQFWARAWGKALVGLARVPIEVQGLEHLTPGRPYVFAANHRSDFDIFILLTVLPGRLMFVAKESLFRIPVFGPALARMGSVPLDRDNLKKAMQSLDIAAARIKAGASMIIYPEGTRVDAAELAPFKKGVFIMAAKAAEPIVPVAISGTRFIKSPGSIQVRPGPVRVVLSPPINPRDYKRKEDLMAAVYQAIAANYDPYYPYGHEPAHA